MLALIYQKMAALVAYTATDFQNLAHMLNEEYGARKLNVAEVPRRVEVRQSVRGAHGPGLEHAHSGVEQAAYDRFIAVIGVARRDLHDGILANLFGRQHTELDSDDLCGQFVLIGAGITETRHRDYQRMIYTLQITL